MSNNPLDKHIKDALDKIEQKPPIWSPPPFESFSEGATFDSFMKSSLQDESLSEKGDWNEFLDTHADQIATKHPVDQIVEEQFSSATAGTTASDWTAVENRLDLQDRRVRTIAIIKSIELALLLLLISSIGTLPFIGDTANDLKKVSAQQTKKDQIISSPGQNSASGEVPPFIPAQKGKEQENLLEGSDRKKRSTTRDIKNQQEANLSVIDDPAEVGFKNNGTKKTEISFFAEALGQLNLIGEFTGNKKPSEQGQSAFAAQQKTDEPEVNSIGTQALVRIPYSELRSFSMSPFGAKADIHSATLINELSDLPKNPEKIHSYGLGIGWQFNRVQTAEDPIYPLPEQVQLDQNLAVGFEWEERTEENAFGFTAGYQKWGYVAPQFTEIYRGDGTQDLQFIQLNRIQFNLINFGLFARKYISSSSDWEFFIHFGGGFRLALKSNYRVQSGDLSSIDANRGDLTDEELENLPKAPLLFNKNFQEGLFQGGSINENSFMTIDIGGGIVHHLSDNWHLQLSPIFNLSPFSDGLGPNRDRVQSLTFHLQIKRTIR